MFEDLTPPNPKDLDSRFLALYERREEMFRFLDTHPRDKACSRKAEALRSELNRLWQGYNEDKRKVMSEWLKDRLPEWIRRSIEMFDGEISSL